MTDLLLKNKKILKEDITEFIYNNEVFSNEITDIITKFEKNYKGQDQQLILNDKVPIYKYCVDDKNNINFCEDIIKDFMEIFKYFDNLIKESNNTQDEIKGETKLSEIVEKLKDSTSTNFIKLFENNDSLTII